MWGRAYVLHNLKSWKLVHGPPSSLNSQPELGQGRPARRAGGAGYFFCMPARMQTSSDFALIHLVYILYIPHMVGKCP